MSVFPAGLLHLAYTKPSAKPWEIKAATIAEAARQQRLSAHYHRSAQLFADDHEYWARRMEYSAAHARLARSLMGMRE